MKNFRDYQQLIRDCVKKISDEDPNWNFSVKSIAKDRVRIRWTYLDYCQEKENCFYLAFNHYDEFDQEHLLVSRTPQDEMISGHLVTDRDYRRSWQITYENGIKYAIEEIADYAHNVY